MKVKTIQNYHYLLSGLEYIYVKKVKSIQTPYGEAINIPNAKDLHNKIAIAILEHNIPLRGKELRFLRKTCGIKQVDLSNWLGVGQSTIANWEGKDIDKIIDSSHSYFLQQLFREKFKLSILGPTKFKKIQADLIGEKFKIAV